MRLRALLELMSLVGLLVACAVEGGRRLSVWWLAVALFSNPASPLPADRGSSGLRERRFLAWLRSQRGAADPLI